MQKKVLVIGITIVLISLGFSGCEELGISVLSPREIKEYPDKYLGKSIRVEGYYVKGVAFIIPDSIVSIVSPKNEAEVREMLASMLPIENHNEDLTLINGGKYRFTGLLKLYEDEFFRQQHTFYLEVSKVQPV